MRRFLTVLAILLIAIPVTLGGLGLLWFVAAKLAPDERLDPEVALFYRYDPEIFLKDNALIGMIGILAPREVDDSEAWALDLARASYADEQVYAKKVGREKAAAESWSERVQVVVRRNVDGEDAPASLQARLLAQPGILVAPDSDSLLGPGVGRGFNCLLERGWKRGSPLVGEENPCRPEAELKALVDAHRLEIERYRRVFSRGDFVAGRDGMAFYSLMIDIHTLFLADLILSGPSEASLAAWTENARFLQRLLQGHNGMIARALLLAMEGMSQRALPSILPSDPRILARHAVELQALLAPVDPAQMKVARMMRYDMEMVLPMLSQMPPRTRNHFHRNVKTIIAAAALPPEERIAACRPVDEERDYTVAIRRYFDWQHPYLGMVGAVLSSGLFVCQDELMQPVDARNRLLGAYVKGRIAKIPGAKLEAFLDGSGITDRNGEPFRVERAPDRIGFTNSYGDEESLAYP